jgi:glycosyltransferase involved in cell wall biosynthesis
MLSAMDVLRPQGVDFTVLAPDTGPLSRELDQRGINRHALEMYDRSGQRRSRATLVERIVEFAATSGADLVHANSLSMSRVLGASAAAIDVPCCGHLRDIVKLSRSAVDDLNGNALLLAVSQATRSFHIQQGVDPRRLRVMYNGVDCSLFRPRDGDGALRRELDVGSRDLLVLQIGQISLRKAQDVYVEAAVGCITACPQMHFVLVGERHSQKSESIEFEQSLIRRIDAAGLNHRFHRLGRRDDIAHLMNDCDILVHTSRQEPLGRVLLEAGASGLPIVATHVGGTSEIFPDESSAIIVAADDPEAISSRLVRLADNPSLRQRLAAGARQRVCDHFEVQRSAGALRSCWESLISGQSAADKSDAPSEGLP